jgi:hypothetical protein
MLSFMFEIFNEILSPIKLLLQLISDRPPYWRPVFSFLGFGVAVVWIYAIANEGTKS